MKQLVFKNNDATQFMIILMVAMLYVACKLVCNPLFFRQIELSIIFLAHPLKLTGSALIYPLIYILSDLIVALTNKKTAVIIALFGIFCDGIFSFTTSYISASAIPPVMSPTELANATAVNIFGINMWAFYYHGVIAAIVAAIAEILIFATLFKRMKNFLVSTLTSVIVTLVVHNLINDYQMLKHEPDVWSLIINNWLVNITVIFVYTLIVTGINQTINRLFCQMNG